MLTSSMLESGCLIEVFQSLRNRHPGLQFGKRAQRQPKEMAKISCREPCLSLGDSTLAPRRQPSASGWLIPSLSFVPS
jgi:hypothetical protein